MCAVTDPWELSDLANKTEHAATIATLRAKLVDWLKQQGDLRDQTEREAFQHQSQ